MVPRILQRRNANGCNFFFLFDILSAIIHPFAMLRYLSVLSVLSMIVIYLSVCVHGILAIGKESWLNGSRFPQRLMS